MALSTDTFRVFVRRNAFDSAGKEAFVDVSPKMSFKKFLKQGGRELGIKAVRCYVPTAGGGYNEINFLDELKMNDVVVLLASGEEFQGMDGSAQKEDEQLSVSVLGTGGVGKSALTLRFVRDFFVQDWDPTIEDAYRKTVYVDGKSCALSILDTAGQEDFESLRHQWMMDKDGYVFVYSVNSRRSLEELESFFNLHQHINNSNPNVPIVLVANKKDLTDLDPKKRQVSLKEGMEKARQFGAFHLETSAATGEHVNEVFETLIRTIRGRKKPTKKDRLGSKCAIL